MNLPSIDTKRLSSLWVRHVNFLSFIPFFLASTCRNGRIFLPHTDDVGARLAVPHFGDNQKRRENPPSNFLREYEAETLKHYSECFQILASFRWVYGGSKGKIQKGKERGTRAGFGGSFLAIGALIWGLARITITCLLNFHSAPAARILITNNSPYRCSATPPPFPPVQLIPLIPPGLERAVCKYFISVHPIFLSASLASAREAEKGLSWYHTVIPATARLGRQQTR